MNYLIFLPKLSTVFPCLTAGTVSLGPELQSSSILYDKKLCCHRNSPCLINICLLSWQMSLTVLSVASELVRYCLLSSCQDHFPTNWHYFWMSCLLSHAFFSVLNQLIYGTSLPSIFNSYFFFCTFATGRS